MKKLDGKVAIVTGGSSGIGLAAAKLFVDEGAFVYITGRRQSELSKAAKLLEKNIATVQGDIGNLSDIDSLYARVKSDRRKIDVIVANAAFVELKTLAEVTPEHYDKTFNVNAKGTFFTVQKALPLLNDRASIVLVSSSGHLSGPPQYTTYCASKAAQRSFVRTWANDLKSRGIRVNSVSPGPVDTPIFEVQTGNREAGDAMRSAFAKAVPMGRIGTPEEIAKALLFLASSDSSFTTGADLVADGGLTQF
ncbi:MAG: SDR family oxidoreductase [Deltaproteobacteria bacterium]|nr:SDR family oxidoreductase [Deltaproteobacteria bacterium]